MIHFLLRSATVATALVQVPLPCAIAQSLDERVAATVRPITVGATTDDGGTFDGAGASFLLAEAASAEFVVLGESHGNRETCMLTSWLLRGLKGEGFGALALETGPCTTAHMAEIAASRGVPGVTRFVKSEPFAVAFLYWKEEVAMFADAVQRGIEVWGLDQEFIGSPRFLLRILAEQAESEDARALAAAWKAREDAALQTFLKTGDLSGSFLQAAGGDDLAELESAFAGGSAKLREVVAELRATWTVYGHHHAGRYYQNNASRIRLMKRHFADRLRGSDTKVLMKFGSAHAGRGHSPFGQLDVGNHAAERAVARGGESLHVYVLARERVLPDGSTEPFVAASERLARFLACDRAITGDDGDVGQVFDLRALRPALATERLRAAEPELHDFVFAFDVFVLLPRFHASTPLIPLPGSG